MVYIYLYQNEIKITKSWHSVYFQNCLLRFLTMTIWRNHGFPRPFVAFGVKIPQVFLVAFLESISLPFFPSWCFPVFFADAYPSHRRKNYIDKTLRKRKQTFQDNGRKWNPLKEGGILFKRKRSLNVRIIIVIGNTAQNIYNDCMDRLEKGSMSIGALDFPWSI